MPRKKEPTNIKLRSEEIQDVISRPPSWMIRWGNTILLSMVFIGFAFTYFIKYPTIIPGRATVSTKTPPVYVTSKVSGRINKILVQNGQSVSAGEIIAEIDNPVPSESIVYLEAFLLSANNYLKNPGNGQFESNGMVNLYDASADYLKLKAVLEEYGTFLKAINATQKLDDLRAKHSNYLKIRAITVKETELNKADIAYAKEKFKMQEQEYKQGLVSKLEFLNAQSTYNQALKSEEAIKKSIIQTDITLADYQTQINEFIQGRNAIDKAHKDEIVNLISSLQNYIIRWKNDFTIKSPVAGQIDFLGRVKANQLISAADELFAIVPRSDEYEVEMEIPSVGFGKISVGQKVKLKLDNYPYNEYGVVNGVVVGLPVLPKQNSYKVNVDLTNGLVSSYDIALKYSPEMTASAEIITEDIRLIAKFFNSLRSILKN